MTKTEDTMPIGAWGQTLQSQKIHNVFTKSLTITFTSRQLAISIFPWMFTAYYPSIEKKVNPEQSTSILDIRIIWFFHAKYLK